ncbi:glycoside hydrolase family 20 protein [Teratosphaeria destructans]|uniref:Beta-hexosaminidase n=1 Tax=Teratosphaeria destructans TaxID=418781 RepID=A0A9W7SV73_9PEZI|nr:glycoside hydrolase family 20 protein [Teratosphaeria destructans]
MRSRSILSLAVWAGTAAALWPIPSSYVSGSDVLWIDHNVKISYNGASNFSASSNSTPTSKIIINAIERTYDTLFNKNFVPWKFHPRFTDFEPTLTNDSIYIKSIALQQNGPDPENIYRRTVETQDDSYTLVVSKAGEVTITAATSIGLLYGLTTFTQLFYKTASDGCVYTPYAPVEIIDAPKFPWRGLNIDTSRMFMPLSDLYAMIDALSYNKMNRLHWHVTDSQSWPLEIPAMPGLADKGAYIAFQKYSPDDVKAVQEYGALLGVEVVMEIDNPGHTASIAYSHPDLIAAYQESDWSAYAAEPPSGTLKLNSTAVYDFLEKLFDDLWPRLKPYTSYFHLGGDEVNVNAYLLDDTVRSNLSSVLQPLMQKYMDRNMAQIQKAGLIPLVWEEMLLTWNLTLPDNTIVQTWQSDDAVLQTVQKGHKALVGNYAAWYLDCGWGQWLDFYPSSAAAYWPYADYCSPLHNWRVMYDYDPLAGIPSNLSHLVLGGETHIWSEQTDSVNLDTKVWPRTCAAAEVLWSGAKDPVTGQNRSQITASPRLSEMRERLVARGIRAEPIQMPYCTMNGTQCAL